MPLDEIPALAGMTLFMNYRAYWQFYKSCFPFIVTAALVCAVFGIIPAIVVLFTIANGIGFLAFSLLKPQEFYFYYNLGISKVQLFISCCLLNLVVAIPISIAVFTFTKLFLAPA